MTSKGYLQTVDTRAIGNAIIQLGGGRQKVGEKLDLSVGLTSLASIGTRLDNDTPLAVIHAATEEAAARAEQHLLDACTFGNDKPETGPVVREILTG